MRHRTTAEAAATTMPLCLADAASGNEVVRPAIQPSLFSPTHLLVCYFSLPPNELLFTFRGSCICANFGENRYGNATVRVPTDTNRLRSVGSINEVNQRRARLVY